MAETIRKRCERCKHVTLAAPRVVRCKRTERRWGKLFYCWGKLTTEPVPTRERPSLRPQDEAAAKLADVRARITKKMRAMTRMAAAIRELERKAKYYERRAAMSDESIEAERIEAQKRKEARALKRLRRAVALNTI